MSAFKKCFVVCALSSRSQAAPTAFLNRTQLVSAYAPDTHGYA